MNSVNIRIYDAKTSNHFYKMRMAEGEHGATAESIFAAIENI